MALPNLNRDASFSDVVRESTGIQKDQIKLELKNLSTLGEIKNILHDQYQAQLDFRAEQRAAAEEARREALNKLVPEKKEEKTGGPFKGDSTSSFGSLTILAGLFASLTGLDDVIRTYQLPKTIASLSAVLKPLTDSFKNFTKSISVSVLNSKSFASFSAVMKSLTDSFKNFTKSISVSVLSSKPFQAIKNFFEPFFKFLENTKKSLSSFRPASFTKAQSTFKSVGNFMRGLLKFLDNARIYVGVLSLEAFEKAQKAFKSFADFMKPVTNFLVATGKVLMKSDIVAGALNAASRAVSKFTGFLSPVLNFFKGTSQIAGPISKIMPILKLGGRLFIGPILAVIDFVQGFMKGFGGEDGSFVKGLFFGFTEVFKGFVTYPLDLIKSGISWLLGKLGFKVAEDALDSFTFSGGVDRFVEGITDDPLGMIAKIATLPFDIIKGGISWVLGKLGFKGGAEALDNFSFGDTFGSLIKGDFDLFGKVSKFFSDIGDGISKIFGFIPSMKEIKAAILNSLPDWALEGLDKLGLLDDDAKNLLEVRSKSKEIAEKQKEIEELETKKENAKAAPGIAGIFKKSKEEVQAEIDEEIAEKKKMLAKDQEELRQARGRVYVDKISADERTDEQLRAEVRDNSLGSIKFQALQARAKSTNDDIRGSAKEELAEANRKRQEAQKILEARELREKEKVERLEKEQAMKKAEGQIIQELGDGNISIGEAKYRRLKESQKDSLKNSLVNNNQKTGAAIDAAAAAKAANQNQQVNVVSAPQTDASTTNNIQTTNVAPGAAMARNPDSSYRMGTFRAL
jgi:hypothetical protein